MRRHDIDWKYIRRYTLVPFLCASLAALAFCIAVWMHSSQLQRESEMSANQFAVNEGYNALVSQRRVIDRYYRRYQRFYDLGFIGRESRLDWVETIRTISTSLELPVINYSIEPQRDVVPPVSSILGGEDIQIKVSQLQLEMDLLHEIDLLRFFDRLQSQAPGLITVDHCDISDISGDGNISAEPNLNAACSVRIFSVITSDVQGESI